MNKTVNANNNSNANQNWKKFIIETCINEINDINREKNEVEDLEKTIDLCISNIESNVDTEAAIGKLKKIQHSLNQILISAKNKKIDLDGDSWMLYDKLSNKISNYLGRERNADYVGETVGDEERLFKSIVRIEPGFEIAGGKTGKIISFLGNKINGKYPYANVKVHGIEGILVIPVDKLTVDNSLNEVIDLLIEERTALNTLIQKINDFPFGEHLHTMSQFVANLINAYKRGDYSVLSELQELHDAIINRIKIEPDKTKKANLESAYESVLGLIHSVIGPNGLYDKGSKLKEVAPPGMEDFVLKVKPKLMQQYGDKKGRKVAYALAWKRHNKKFNEAFDATKPLPMSMVAFSVPQIDIDTAADIIKSNPNGVGYVKNGEEQKKIYKYYLDKGNAYCFIILTVNNDGQPIFLRVKKKEVVLPK